MAIWYNRNEKIHNTIIMRNYETHMRNYTRWETQYIYIKIQIEIKKIKHNMIENYIFWNGDVYTKGN